MQDLLLLLRSLAFNHTMGRYIECVRSRHLMVAGIGVNLLLLGCYSNALDSSLRRAAPAGAIWPASESLCRKAVSFFAFTQRVYLVDAYRGETKHMHRFVTVFRISSLRDSL